MASYENQESANVTDDSSHTNAKPHLNKTFFSLLRVAHKHICFVPAKQSGVGAYFASSKLNKYTSSD
jgi:hypothetical protein